jgi:hypothetical protein
MDINKGKILEISNPIDAPSVVFHCDGMPNTFIFPKKFIIRKSDLPKVGDTITNFEPSGMGGVIATVNDIPWFYVESFYALRPSEYEDIPNFKNKHMPLGSVSGLSYDLINKIEDYNVLCDIFKEHPRIVKDLRAGIKALKYEEQLWDEFIADYKSRKRK